MRSNGRRARKMRHRRCAADLARAVQGRGGVRLQPARRRVRLARHVKAGFWYHAGRFDDLRYGADGLSLAGPGITRRHGGNHGLYAVIDQMLWRAPDAADGGISGFMRLSATPGDRNLVVFYADGA